MRRHVVLSPLRKLSQRDLESNDSFLVEGKRSLNLSSVGGSPYPVRKKEMQSPVPVSTPRDILKAKDLYHLKKQASFYRNRRRSQTGSLAVYNKGMMQSRRESRTNSQVLLLGSGNNINTTLKERGLRAVMHCFGFHEQMRLRLVSRAWNRVCLGLILENFDRQVERYSQSVDGILQLYGQSILQEALRQNRQELRNLFEPIIKTQRQAIWEISSYTFVPPPLQPLLECLRLLLLNKIKGRCGCLLVQNNSWRKVFDQIFNLYPGNNSIQCQYYYSQSDMQWFLDFFDFEQMDEVESILHEYSATLQKNSKIHRMYGRLLADINFLVHGLVRVFRDYQAQFGFAIDYMRAIKFSNSIEAIICSMLKKRYAR